MNDKEFDDVLNDAAASYNRPGDIPREAMWSAIARARSEAPVVDIARGRAWRWVSAAAGIAAVLVVGIMIGRQSKTQPEGRQAVAVATNPATVVEPSSALTGSSRDQIDRPTERSSLPVASVPRSVNRAAARVRPDVSNDDASYRLAVVEHLARTEVLLTDFRSRSRSTDARLGAEFATLSRDLLSTTRVLIATRHADDPTMTRLLQDLELVLMQISQYATDGRGIDLDAVNQSIERRNVLPKLRSTIPAGGTSAGTRS